MTNQIEGLPSDVTADLTASSITLTIDASLYPLEALYAAAYVFIDRCYVFLDKTDAGKYRVVLATKAPGAERDALRTLVGEFSNELLGAAWRVQITEQNRSVIEALTTQALAGAMGPPSLDELASFDFTEESFEDPLGIATSWEDKYKKKDKAEGAAASDGEPSAPAADAPAPGRGATGEGSGA